MRSSSTQTSAFLDSSLITSETGDVHRAVRIVESLFRVTPATCWDLLLDLRQALLEGWDASRMQPLFQRCRRELEEDHYLLFYRLRRLLGPSMSPSKGKPVVSAVNDFAADLVV